MEAPIAILPISNGVAISKEGLRIKWGGHMLICGGTRLARKLIYCINPVVTGPPCLPPVLNAISLQAQSLPGVCPSRSQEYDTSLVEVPKP